MDPGAPKLPPAYGLVAFDSIDSTNDEAKRLARGGAPDNTLVWARSQSAGRGRGGRTWLSPPGNLYLSIVLRPESPTHRAVELGFVAAVALGAAIEELVGPDPRLAFKWPNDVLFDGRKVAGILIEAESAAEPGRLDWMVLGVGVNVRSHPEETAFPATSLAGEGCPPVTAEALRDAFAAQFLAWRGRWQDEGFAPVRAAWLARAKGIGAQITVRLPNATLQGTFIDLDADGALLLGAGTGDADIRRISAGDVFFG